MAQKSPGRPSGLPRRKPNLTPTEKAYRYESFTKRIAKLRIDPIHRVQQSRIRDSSEDISQSFFRTALAEYTELNLATTFTSFLTKVNGLSESLPQILYHADQIHALLLEHIEKRDPLALEPLLSLVAHLAHDLGQGFEKYFLPTTEVVAKVASLADDATVIESCFTCLTWMCKYLSKLIVADLRPLLSIMIPYLTAKRHYIRRFAAESLAFLVRKSAMHYSRQPKPLMHALKYLFDRLIELTNKCSMLHMSQTIMILLHDSTEGVDASLHTSASNVLRCTIDIVLSDEKYEPCESVISGFVTACMHRTDGAGFAPMLDVILELNAASLSQSPAERNRHVLTRLLVVATGVRGGSKVHNWNTIISLVLRYFNGRDLTQTRFTNSMRNLVKVTALVVVHAPLADLLPNVEQLLQTLMVTTPTNHFLSFSEIVARANLPRFRDLVLAPLQKFLSDNWNEQQAGFAELFLKLHELGLFERGNPKILAIPKSWEESLCHGLMSTVEDSRSLILLQLNRIMEIPRTQETRAVFVEALQNTILKHLRQSAQDQNFSERVSFGWALQALVSSEKDSAFLDNIWPKLVQKFQSLSTLLPFLEASLKILPAVSGPILLKQPQNQMVDNLLDNLRHQSVKLRQVSLNLLQYFIDKSAQSKLLAVRNVLQEILALDYSLVNERQLAMLVRKLPLLHKSIEGEGKLQSLVPLFTIGLLQDYYDQLRQETAFALSQMLTSPSLEELVLETMREWLQGSALSAIEKRTVLPTIENRPNQFECTRLNDTDMAFATAEERYALPQSTLEDRVRVAHQLSELRAPTNSRLIALQVLRQMPQTVEKRSKLLVPVFLSAQADHNNSSSFSNDDLDSIYTLSAESESGVWTSQERKLLLQLLGSFQNPRVLYRSEDVHDILLELLSNGDAETSKLSLQALLKWKDKTITSQYEKLMQIAEDKITTIDLAQLLLGEQDFSSISVQERDKILPIVLRLIFGQMIRRGGNHGTQDSKRKALLRSVFRLPSDDIHIFLDIVLGDLQDVTITSEGMTTQLSSQCIVSLDRRYGFLRMVLSMLEVLQTQFSGYGHKIMNAVLYCTVHATHQMDMERDGSAPPVLVQNIRRTGLQCVNLLFEYCEMSDDVPYLELIDRNLIQPRLNKFVAENAQSISGLLKLCATWATRLSSARYLLCNQQDFLTGIWDLLAFEYTKPETKLFILENIIKAFHRLSELREIPDELHVRIREQVDPILERFIVVLEKAPAKLVLTSVSQILRNFAGYHTNASTATRLTELMIKVLNEPNQRLPPHIKGQMLLAIESLMRGQQLEHSHMHTSVLYDEVSSFFDFFRDVPNRQTCCRLLVLLSQGGSVLKERIADICQDLNAFSTSTLDDVDFDRRNRGYSRIHELLENKSANDLFEPLVNNLVFIVRTNVDTSLRGNATGCLRHIVQKCPGEELEHSRIQQTLLMAIKKHIKDKSEIVCADFVDLLGVAVKFWTQRSDLKDMKPLLQGDNEDEASFFTNVLHIQQHRRTRAIRRLTTEIEKGEISAENIANYFLPLLKRIVDNDDADAAPATRGQAVASMSILMRWLDWKHFRQIFRQYAENLTSSQETDRINVRSLDHAADALISVVSQGASNAGVVPYLKSSLPSEEILVNELKARFITKLAGISHYKDEAMATERLPAAVLAVKLITLLPKDEQAFLASPIVLDVAQVLRSRTQETRDLARKKLADIATLLGPSSIQFIVKELRNVLTQGYQRHVLSYTTHTLLLAGADARSIGELDYCLEDLVNIVLDDVFGMVGEEKENQDYISSMKEVKRNKSYDTVEMLAQSASIESLPKLVLPFEPLLAGNLSSKQARSVDELFRRIGVGISHGTNAGDRSLLVFTYELIQAFYRAKTDAPAPIPTNGETNRSRYLVQVLPKKATIKATSGSLLYKLVKFAIDIARSTFARHEALLQPANVHGFLPVIGDALIEAQEDVKVSAIRLLSTIMKLEMPEVCDNGKLYVIECVKILKSSTNTNEEAAQAALKLTTSILRGKSDVDVRDSDVSYILKRIAPDLEEPDKQGVTFSFIKAVMARRYEIPEVYELADKLGHMMITSQSRSSRDAARGVYIHFLLDYPQSKARWTKQIKFLVKNLEYQHPEGRQNVMEGISVLLNKLDKNTTNELISVIFVPVVLRMASDENQACRELAGALLAQLFSKVNVRQVDSILETLRAWLAQDENTMLKQLSLQVWSLYFKNFHDGTAEIPELLKIIQKLLQNAIEDDQAWEPEYRALEVLVVLAQANPDMIFSSKRFDLWSQIIVRLSSTQLWLKTSASTLVRMLLSECGATKSFALPFSCLQGMHVDERMTLDVLKASMKILKSSSTTTSLAQTATENLQILSKVVDVSDVQMQVNGRHDDIKSEDSDSSKEDMFDNILTSREHIYIPATQYLMDQSAYILRREPTKQTVSRLQPKLYILNFLGSLLRILDPRKLSSPSFAKTTINLFLPLLHITNPNTPIPRSPEQDFATTYQTIIENAHLVLEVLQSILGDQAYSTYVSAASKLARERRQDRRSKRAFDAVAEPERAAVEKRRKHEKKKDRRKEIGQIHRGKRRRDLGF